MNEGTLINKAILRKYARGKWFTYPGGGAFRIRPVHAHDVLPENIISARPWRELVSELMKVEVERLFSEALLEWKDIRNAHGSLWPLNQDTKQKLLRGSPEIVSWVIEKSTYLLWRMLEDLRKDLPRQMKKFRKDLERSAKKWLTS
jgi:hypothetical protein